MANKKAISFLWEGKNKQGVRVKGEIAGKKISLVKAELRTQGITSLKVRKKPTGLFAPRQKKITAMDITAFSRQLATMIAAGVPLVQAFDIVGKGHESPSMQKLIFEMRSDLESGSTLTEALQKHNKYFSELYCNLIFAGEQAGALESMLSRLATYLEKVESIKKKIKKALMYPIIVLSIALAVSAGLLIFVVPQFAEIYKSFDAELPLFTQQVIALSEFLEAYWWLFFGGIFGAIFGFIQLKKRNIAVAIAFDKYLLRLPIIGGIINKAIIARFTRTLSTTFAAGMPLVDALTAAAGTSGNLIYQQAIYSIRDKVTTGIQLQVALRETQLFPNMVNQMIAIGEESGALEHMLNKVSDYYEEIVDNAIDNLSTLMEPIIMVILAILIGSLVIAMYLPIFKLGEIV